MTPEGKSPRTKASPLSARLQAEGQSESVGWGDRHPIGIWSFQFSVKVNEQGELPGIRNRRGAGLSVSGVEDSAAEGIRCDLCVNPWAHTLGLRSISLFFFGTQQLMGPHCTQATLCPLSEPAGPLYLGGHDRCYPYYIVIWVREISALGKGTLVKCTRLQNTKF